MYKTKFFLLLVIMILVLTGCINDTTSRNSIARIETISLEHLITPQELTIYTPEANKIALEMNRISKRIIEEFNNEEELSDKQMKEFEKLKNNYQSKCFEFTKHQFSIDDPDEINRLFDKIKDSKAVTSDYLNDEKSKKSNHYLVHVDYEEEDKLRLADGNILCFWLFDDNTLVIVAKAKESMRSTMEIEIEFDYDLFEDIIYQMPINTQRPSFF